MIHKIRFVEKQTGEVYPSYTSFHHDIVLKYEYIIYFSIANILYFISM